MIDAETQQVLQHALRREGRSLLQYVRAADLWSAAGHGDAIDAVRRMSRVEEEAVADLSRYLARRRVPPAFLGSYPMYFTSFNFVSVDFLLPRLADQQEKDIETLKTDLSRLTDPEARAPLESLLALKKNHLTELQSLARPQSVAS